MQHYSIQNTLSIAKRQKNAKRNYLLVNPLQAKHIPVSPSASLAMMRCLGKRLAKKYPGTSLVIGFAETATAIGATVADCFGDNCIYIHTTREDIPKVGRWLYFLEEHSHAVEQKIDGDRIQEWLQNTPQIIFVDDELSTGKTLINMVEQLRKQFPELTSTKMVAASIMNRLTPENMDRLAAAGIESEYLVKLENFDYTDTVSAIETVPAEDIFSNSSAQCEYLHILLGEPLMNPRLGVNMSQYTRNCRRISSDAIKELVSQLHPQYSVLVLGTEECMYPALIIGEEIERQGLANSVACHATTRSPIGVCAAPGYPITEGYKIHSFYDAHRETYVYDLHYYDVVIVVSDAQGNDDAAMNNLALALSKHGYGQLFALKGGHYV